MLLAAAAQRSIICMLYFYGLPFVIVLPLLLLTAVVFIRTSCATVVIYTATGSAVATIRRVACSAAAAVRTATKNVSVCFLVFGVLSLHSTMLHPLAIRDVACTASVCL